MKRIFASLAISLLVSGCVQTPYWTLTDKTNRIVKSTSFEISVPDGWVRTTNPETLERVDVDGEIETVELESMAVTRDGTGIHAISVTRRYPGTAFPAIKKKSRHTMLAPEVADLYLSELRKRTGLERLTVVSNKPAKVGGKPGFQLVMQYKNDDGLRIQIMTYGFVDNTGFYTLTHRAPYLYFYERDQSSFEKLVASFRQLKGASEPPPDVPRWAEKFS